MGSAMPYKNKKDRALNQRNKAQIERQRLLRALAVIAGVTLHTYNASIDRKNPKLGYIEGNVRLVCFWTNIARYNLTDTQFKAWCKKVVA